MKVYLSSTRPKRTAEGVALLKAVWGYELVSTWHDTPKVKASEKAEWAELAVRNFSGIKVADVVVALAERKGGHGVQVEIGYALGVGKPVVMLALWPPSSLLWHPGVKVVATVDELEVELKRLAAVAKPAAKRRAKRTVE